MKEQILYPLNNIVISLIFCIAIFVPFFMGLIEQDKQVSKIERRTFAHYPAVPKNVEDIKKYPLLFDKYYSDHFGLREWLTQYYRLAKYTLGDSPSQDVTLGKNGWLFLGSIKNAYQRYEDPIGDVRNVNLYSLQGLKDFAERMNVIKERLNQKGIAYVFVIAPNKHTIYSEHLPDYIIQVNQQSATDQLVDYLKKQTNIVIVDLRDSLIKEKNKHRLYNKTGTHWNHYGANIAQYEIMKVIGNIFPTKISPELLPDSRFEFHITTDRGLERLLGVRISPEPIAPFPLSKNSCLPEKYIHEKKDRYIYTMTCKGQTLNAVIFRDSFFDALQPYFSRKFKRSTYILEILNFPRLEKYIELEKPDLIIEEWVERKLPYVPKIE